MNKVTVYKDVHGDCIYHYNGKYYGTFDQEVCMSSIDNVLADIYASSKINVFGPLTYVEDIPVPSSSGSSSGNPYEMWKIRYLRHNRNVSKGEAVITLLYREVDDKIEYKFAVCNPTDNFCRKTGKRVALDKKSVIIHNNKPVDVYLQVFTHLICSAEAFGLSKEAKDTLFLEAIKGAAI